jgi:hypothetical protein
MIKIKFLFLSNNHSAFKGLTKNARFKIYQFNSYTLQGQPKNVAYIKVQSSHKGID